MKGKNLSVLKNLGILGLIIGIVLMLRVIVNAYSSGGNRIYNCGNSTTYLDGSATDACADCSAALNDNSCTSVKLNADITDHSRRCMDNPANFNNKVFDCQRRLIDGNNDGWDHNLYGKSGNTIKKI